MRNNWTKNLIMVICGIAEEDKHLLAESAVTDRFPPIDIIIRDTCVYIRADIPGAVKEDMCVYINNDRLVIEGIKRPYYPPSTCRKFSRVERQYRPFKREIKLNAPVRPETISTDFQDGVLTISWITE